MTETSRLLVVLLVLAAGWTAAPREAAAQGEAPSFLQVGRTYWIFIADEEAVVEILEIGDGGWVRVRQSESNDEYWLNTNLVAVIREFTPEMQAAERERAYQAAMKSDLRNLAVAQEMYFSDHETYSSKLADLEFDVSEAVQISIGAADGSGWSATARHIRSSLVCRIGMRSKTPTGLAEGEPVCGEQ